MRGAHAGRRGSGAPVLSPVWGGGPRAGGAAFPDSGVGEGFPLQQSGSGAQPGPRPRVPYLFRPRPAFPAFRTHVTFPPAQSVPRGPEACAEAPGGRVGLTLALAGLVGGRPFRGLGRSGSLS